MQVAKGMLILTAALSLSGCMADMPDFKLPFGKGAGKAAAAEPKAEDVARGNTQFSNEAPAKPDILDTLKARRSVLTPESDFDVVAKAALAASARTAEAELRSARLRAEAENKNWLPTLSPSVSLTSLGETIAAILVEQVLLDNGRRKAERAYAAADVEVAAVSLSEDMNERVYTALSLYLAALKGEEKAAAGNRAISRMHSFEKIVIGRVEGGVSDKGDLRMVEGKMLDLRSNRDIAQESAQVARAELRAITGKDFSDTRGVSLSAYAPSGIEALSVIRARAEAKRSIAQATAQRAAILPTLGVSSRTSKNGTDGALDLKADGLGFGTRARMKALESSQETARRSVDEAADAARRNQRRLEVRIQNLTRQEAEAARLVREGRETFRLFEAQFRAGQRSVLEVVNVYEQLTHRELDLLDRKYEMLLTQLELSRDLGVLAEGGEI